MSLPTASSPVAPGAAPVLAAVGLACRRGERRLFSGLDLTLASGRLMWLRGDNGRGKTSLLRLLAGLATPEAGEVLLDGVPVRTASLKGQRPLYIGHANALKDDLSATEALLFLAQLHAAEAAEAGRARLPDRAAVQAALERLGVAHRKDAAVRTLSQGQRRRVALARLALVEDAMPWILDEPYDALDVAGIAALDGLLAAHLQRGGSIILTSHQPVVALARVATEVMLTAKGATLSSLAQRAGAEGLPA
jgi:heme exporter protein A